MRLKHCYKSMEGFSVEVKVREGRLYFADPIMSGPIFYTRQDAERCCIHVIVENNYRGGLFDEATLRPFNGRVSTMEIEPNPFPRRPRQR